LATLNGEVTDRVPVAPLLIHLAADRAGITFREFATNGVALADAQLSLQERFDLDAITAGSDGLRMSSDLGGDVQYPEAKPPYLRTPLIGSAADLPKLGTPDPADPGGRMGDRVLAVSRMVQGVSERAAVLGWIGMPYAEACFLCGISEFMMLMMNSAGDTHRILSTLTEFVIDFALAQVEVGADMIGASDPAASMVSGKMYREFILPYEKMVCTAIHDAGSLVNLHICGDTNHLLDAMVGTGADLFNIDHPVSLQRARDVFSAHSRSYKGNLNPVSDLMRASPRQCRTRAHECISIALGTRYMLSAGCEIPAETPDEVLVAFCSAPKTFRQE
jgi:MtaA/CmuA family methyltransferase